MARHSDATVHKALTLLLFSSSVQEVISVLKDEGITVDRNTIVKWRDEQHVELYRELHDRYKDEIEANAIRRMRERMSQADRAERMAVDAVIGDLEGGRLRGKDAAMAALNMSRVKQTNADKLLALTGRPNEIIEDRTGDVTLRVVRELMATGVLKRNGTDPIEQE